MKILVIKTSALGDIIHCYPVIAYLREKFPNAQLDWIVDKQCQDLVTRHPHIHKAYVADTKEWRKKPLSVQTIRKIKSFKREIQNEFYDVIFDLQGNIKSSIFTFLAKGKEKVGFGWKTVPEWPNLLFTHIRFDPPPYQNIRLRYLHIVQQHFGGSSSFESSSVELRTTPEEKKFLDAILQHRLFKEGQKVIVSPGAHWKNKRLPKSILISILKQVPGSPHFFFTWGTEEEKKMVESLHIEFPNQSLVVPKLPLAVLQNLFLYADLVIAMDSLPLHLAGTTNIQTLSFFGPSLAEVYKPLGLNHFSYQGTCPYHVTFEKRCPYLRNCSTGACLQNKFPVVQEILNPLIEEKKDSSRK